MLQNTFWSLVACVMHEGTSSRGGGRGGRAGEAAVPPATELGGNISFCPPPPRNVEGALKKNCVGSARNSITPYIPLVETGQVRKIGTLGSQRGPCRFRGPRKSIYPPPNWCTPENIPLVETGQARKVGAPRLPNGAPPIQRPSQIGLPPLESAFRRH